MKHLFSRYLVVILIVFVVSSLCNDGEVRANGQEAEWQIAETKVNLMHEAGIKGEGVNIAILDTGIQVDHAYFNQENVTAYDCSSEGTCELTEEHPVDDHGTRVASMIIAQNNDKGVSGVAPEAQLTSFDILNDESDYLFFSEEKKVAALNTIKKLNKSENKDKHISIVNMSFNGNLETTKEEKEEDIYEIGKEQYQKQIGGLPSNDEDIRNSDSIYKKVLALGTAEVGRINDVNRVFNELVSELQDDGVIFVTGAGNANSRDHGEQSKDYISTPANLEGVITVAAYSQETKLHAFRDEDNVLRYSPYSDFTDVSAPWNHLKVAKAYKHFWQSKYDDDDRGTSLSSPLVAGILALYKSSNSDLTSSDLKDIIFTNARDIGSPGWDKEHGHGLIQALPLPGKITGVQNSTDSNDTETLQWDESPRTKVYKVEYKKEGQADYLWFSDTDNTTVTLNELDAGTYKFKITPWNLVGPGKSKTISVSIEEREANFIEPVTTNGIKFNNEAKGDVNLNVTPNAVPTLTFEAWVKPDAKNDFQYIWSTDVGSYHRGLMITAGNKFAVQTGSGNWLAADADMGKWQHIAVVFKNDDILFYKNGQKIEYGHAPPKANGSQTLTVGYNSWQGLHSNSSIKDVRFWSTEKSVRQLNQTLTGQENHLLAWWKMDESAGNVAKDSGPSNKDVILSHSNLWINTPHEDEGNVGDNPLTGLNLRGSESGRLPININPNKYPVISFEGWVKPNNTFEGLQYVWTTENNSWNRALLFLNGKIGVATGHSVWYPVDVDYGKWQHIAVVYTEDDIFLYKNGIKHVYGRPSTHTVGVSYVDIGAVYGGYGYSNITISDFRFWDKALGQNDLNRPVVGKGGLIARMQFDEMTGSVVHEEVNGLEIPFSGQPSWYQR